MTEKNSTSFVQQITLTIITLLLGSLIFVGIIENYKSDESIKLTQLEKYFIKTRKEALECRVKHNKLIKHYASYGDNIALMFNELKHVMDNPELMNNPKQNIVMKSYADTLLNMNREQNKLPQKIVDCRNDLYLNLESLAIITGSYEYFSEQSLRRDSELEFIHNDLKEKLSTKFGSSFMQELHQMLRKFISISTEEEMKALILENEDKVKLMQEFSEINSNSELEKFKAQDKFYANIRNRSAEKLSDKFSYGFLSWLIH